MRPVSITSSLFLFITTLSVLAVPAKVDALLAKQNSKAEQPVLVAKGIDDLTFLRRASVDVIGRIPTAAEVHEFQKWPATERRTKLVEKLLAHPRYADRWTVFFSDILRIRSNATGGNAFLAYLHQSLSKNRSWDVMSREMLSANGSSGKVPAVGLILGEDVDAMAMAAATSQMFLGVRMQCAQCHNHPFDVWKQKQFYELATYFGKTRRIENQFSRRVYTTEGNETTVLWPPERKKPPARNPVAPKFPFELEEFTSVPSHVKRFETKRAEEALAASGANQGKSLSALLDEANPDAAFENERGFGKAVAQEAKAATQALDIEGDLYRQSVQRTELAEKVTSPYNRYFARNMVNRMWAELIGRGFYEPVDDFQDIVTHRETLNYLSDEFVASGYDIKALIRMIMMTKAYSRGHLAPEVALVDRRASEENFASAATRRMVSEVLYDSIVVAGHLTDYKWPAGANMRTYTERVRMVDGVIAGSQGAASGNTPNMAPGMMAQPMAGGGYDLEGQIALNFDELLKSELEKDLASMKMMSDAELERQQQMQAMAQPGNTGPRRTYKYVEVERKVDDNPRFGSTMRIATPAPPAHFLRVFGQPARDSLANFREHTPSMRQQLMMLNGKATHEAARVGPMEPMHTLLGGDKQDVTGAIKLAYLEILTREPDAEELAFAREVVGAGKPALDGMADLRWALLNSNEFRYIP